MTIKKNITFVFEMETKNTARYEEEAEGQPPMIGTLYVQKWAPGKDLPKKITVTIEAQ